MSNETIVQNGATSAIEDKKQNAAGTSVGKIGRLPKNIREEFNRRIEDGQAASEILPWVNGLPATKTVLGKLFGGVPISDGNLSLWRRTGYKRWQEKEESVAELKMLAEDAKDFSEATDGSLARGAASIAAAKILKLLHTIQPEQGSIEELTKISYAVTALLSAEQSQVRLEYEKTRVFQGNERLVLSWDKFLRSRVETAQRALEDAICKDIQAADIDNGEKIELLGHELFGKKWQGREVGKKEAPKKGTEGPKNGSGKSAESEKPDTETADQQVRPTTAQGHSTEAVVPGGEKAIGLKASGGLTTAATKAEAKKMDVTPEQHTNRHSLRELEAHVPTRTVGSVTNPVEPKTTSHTVGSTEKGREDTGGDFTIAATKAEAEKTDVRTADQQVRPTTVSNPKQKPQAQEAQFAPVKNIQPKPQENPMAPKPSPWDAFSEPVSPSPFAAFQPKPLRPAPGFNTLG